MRLGMRSASSYKDKVELNKWERRVGQLGERLAPEPEAADNLAQKLRDVLDSQIEKQSSNPSLHNHFSELFAGLDTLSDPLAPLKPRDGLSGERTEQDIIKWFDKLYYQGQLSYKTAVAILKDSRVKSIEHLVQQVNNGGILIRWSGQDKHFFQLHVANKFWRLGEKELARQYVAGNFAAVWLPELVADRLPPSRLNILLRAVVATQPDLALDAAHQLAEHERHYALYILWTNSVLFKRWQVANAVTYGARSDTLFQALALVTDAAQTQGADGLAPLLKLVPRRRDFRLQVSSALVEVGGRVPALRRPLADKLVAVEADEATEARIAAFRLSLD